MNHLMHVYKYVCTYVGCMLALLCSINVTPNRMRWLSDHIPTTCVFGNCVMRNSYNDIAIICIYTTWIS